MALLEVNWNPERRELKQFALIWMAMFGIFGAISLWAKSSTSSATAFWIIAAFGLLGYFRPAVLKPVYIVWMALAMPIGWAVSHLLLLAVFYLVLTPIGLLLRLFGHDPLNRQFDRAAKSYWIPHDPSHEPARYFKQF